MKTYVITLSKRFPAKHKRAGEPTNFAHLLPNGLPRVKGSYQKIHTIRANYPLWEKRLKAVERGEAVISIRQWEDKPYRSKQHEIARLSSADRVGIQKLEATNLGWFIDSYDSEITNEDLAHNDGLSTDDFKEWFRGYDLSQPLAIIHFTKFRYDNSFTENNK